MGDLGDFSTMRETGEWRSGRPLQDFQNSSQREVITSDCRDFSIKAGIARTPGDLRWMDATSMQHPEANDCGCKTEKHTSSPLLNSRSRCPSSQTDLTCTQGESDAGAPGISSRSRGHCSRDMELLMTTEHPEKSLKEKQLGLCLVSITHSLHAYLPRSRFPHL